MAEQLPNGTTAPNIADVEMKEEEPPLEVPSAYAQRLQTMLMEFKESLSTVQQEAAAAAAAAAAVATPTVSVAGQTDLHDPNPPPQSQTAPIAAADSSTVLSRQEHLSSIAPALATPPASAPARNSSMPPQPSARPEKPVAHGGPTRQFLNSHITPHLLEGMKYLAVYEPEKPLLWLSEFLRDRSKEVEGS